ncbi:LysE family translocator [Desulfovibrio mangrovi]|uniref:LysE family translocator n=1 Tax=Desulfovibrio mangrovi TaxID=2976983 RepID=UPI002245D1C1|nr:LysE family translocator [Desulfovibrio mangrovi]UZP66981.1 LysE family translocator [Desulfovibrio mangrovi]
MEVTNGLSLTANLLPLMLFCLSMTATPGPNNIMLTASGANFGFRRTLPHMFGIACGMQTMILTVGLGLGRVFMEFPAVHTALEWVGGAYLLYLAWKIANIPPAPVDSGGAGRPMTFMQGLLFQWVNPKCWMMVVGAVATFADERNAMHDVFIIALVFLAVTPPSIGMWALVGVKIRRFLETAFRRRMFNYTMAGLLVGSLVFVHMDKVL